MVSFPSAPGRRLAIAGSSVPAPACFDTIRTVHFEPFVYEERYGWNRQSVRLIVASLVLCVAALIIPMPSWVRIPVIGLLILGAAVLAVSRLSHRTAFRVDATGVTLRASVFSWGDPQFYPWPDIQNLVLWQHTRVWCIGVQRRNSQRAPAEVPASGIGVTDWQLDRHRLAVAVGHFAPQVQIINATALRPALSWSRGRA
jgi:hypothetical protein